MTPWPERVVATITTLVLPPYSAGGAPEITSMRFDGIDGNLIGKYLALLIGDRLAVDRERVLGVVADAVEEAVGIGGDSRRGKSDKRTQGR